MLLVKFQAIENSLEESGNSSFQDVVSSSADEDSLPTTPQTNDTIPKTTCHKSTVLHRPFEEQSPSPSNLSQFPRLHHSTPESTSELNWRPKHTPSQQPKIYYPHGENNHSVSTSSHYSPDDVTRNLPHFENADDVVEDANPQMTSKSRSICKLFLEYI